ncbi:MAG: DUF4941 domain-containing protein [Thermosipho sp. (in: Bacteria)]|nr:DUF4941 domain-containing protein [Thermosipho sp. (in: thermotogales)]
MKKITILFFLLISFTFFSFNIIIDDITIEASSINFYVTKKILETYSTLLNDEKIAFGSLGTFQYIEWKDKLVVFTKDVVVLNDTAVKDITFDDLFDFFEIKYLRKDENYYLASMLIKNLEDIGTYLQIDYLGTNSLSTYLSNNILYLVSKGYVYYERLYSPNEIIFSKKVENTKSIELNELPKRIIIQLLKTYKIESIKYFTFNEKIENYNSNDLVIIFKDSPLNYVFIRNYSPDFNGNDWELFSTSNTFAKKLSKQFNLKLYYVPFIQLPLDAPGIVIFTSSENWEKIKDYLEGDEK